MFGHAYVTGRRQTHGMVFTNARYWPLTARPRESFADLGLAK